MNVFHRAIAALQGADEFHGAMVDNEAYVRALQADDLLVPEVQIIRTQAELEALELNDADAIALAGAAGAVRTVRGLAAMHRLGSVWGLPAVVIATGAQVLEAREAMEQDND